MKKILSLALSILLTFGLVACNSSSNSKNTKEPEKILQKGEAGFMTDKKGDNLYSLTINSVTELTDYEDYDMNSKDNKIIEVSYTYDNINFTETDLCIFASALQVIDSNNSTATASSYYKKGLPQGISTGTNTTAYGVYSLANDSDSVKIKLTSNTTQATLTYEIPIDKK